MLIKIKAEGSLSISSDLAVMADPDLQIRRGPGHPDLEIGRVAVTKKFFSALWASVWSKNKG